MSVRLEVEHTTTYRYARPVRFGPHRLLFRPRASHDIQVLWADVAVSPESRVHWVYDVQSNSVAVIAPQTEADHLEIRARFAVRHQGLQAVPALIAEHARRWPFDYSGDERRELGVLLEPHYPDPEGRLFEWMRPFLAVQVRPDTRQLLVDMCSAIRGTLRYEARDAEGTQTPHETLTRGAGTCRDYALLLIEACRRLGFGARFVSGYLYDPALDSDADGDSAADVMGAGATHAWAQVYLPGAGWMGFDPTNPDTVATNLIRVAFASDPRHAVPLAGSWFGEPGDYLGMEVKVAVRRVRGT
ncbi:MAG: hypothetical protein RL669_2084 [Pseudomonadota bacterium]|jgi:transglutaminase-like putative cysteine protease